MVETINNKRIAKNTVFLAGRMIVVLFIGFYTSRIVLEALGVEDFGIYNAVCGFVSMFTFLNSALTAGIQRFYNYEYGKNGLEGAQKVYNTSIYTQVVLSVIIVLLVEIIGLWFLYNKMVIPTERLDVAFWIFQFSIISMVIVIMQVPFSAAIMAHEKMDYYALVSVCDSFLKLGCVYLLTTIGGDKLLIYGLLMLGITITNFLLYYIYSKIKFSELKFNFSYDKKMFKDVFSFSGWNMFGKFSIMMKEQGVNMLLNLFFGPVVNAARGVAYQVISALRAFVENINIAVKPQLTMSYAVGDVRRSLSLMFSISRLCYFLLLLFSIPLILEINTILNLWLGDNVPEHTANFIIIVILTTFINNLNAPVSYVIHSTGDIKHYQIVTTIIEVLIVPVSYIALRFGLNPESVFIISFIIVAIDQIISLIILKKQVHEFSICAYLRDVVRPLILVSFCSIVIPVLIHMFIENSIVRLIVVTISSIISTILWCFLLGLNNEEKKLLLSYIKK